MNQKLLEKLYNHNKKSSSQIAKALGCSENKINYWLAKYKIKKRTISEAVYLKHNPKGDPFKFTPPNNVDDAKMLGMGLGLYWGEGNKANKNTIRLGNTDPELIKTFIKFLIKIFSVKKEKMRFQLQIFTDINTLKAEKYWLKKLDIKRKQLYKTVITKSGSLGTYKKKSEYGVMTVHYGNTKLKNILVEMLKQ